MTLLEPSRADAPQPIYFAFCWRDGLIELGLALPNDAWPITRGTNAALQRVRELARLSDGGGLFVPGMAETDDPLQKLDALTAFRARLAEARR